MNHTIAAATLLLSVSASPTVVAEADGRVLVSFPERMQQHMMSNMRDHLRAINEILLAMGSGEFDQAADIAEQRLGMSSMGSHGAGHMGKFMPEGMRAAGIGMHRAASRFAIKAEEGDPRPAYQALAGITSACVGCHSGYRVR